MSHFLETIHSPESPFFEDVVQHEYQKMKLAFEGSLPEVRAFQGQADIRSMFTDLLARGGRIDARYNDRVLESFAITEA